MRQIALLFCLLLVILCGCESSQQTEAQPASEAPTKAAPAKPSAAGLFNQPSQPVLVELPSEALAHWRSESTEKPALVLFSYDPLLKPIDGRLQQSARQLALTGSAAQLKQHGSFNTTEPLILPTQTVAAALDAGLFAKFYWIFPSKVQPQQLDLETFRKQLREQQILTAAEIETTRLNNGIFTGSVRGVPFEAVHYLQLKDIDQPFMLHIDTSFFRGLYDNEIKSPLYGLLRDTALKLRGMNWQPLVTSLSWSTIAGDSSLDVRFMISNLAELLRKPAILDGDMPQEWQLRSEALYAGEMYSESKKTELSGQLASVAPESAAAHYDRFQVLFLSRQLEAALQALQQAVSLDPGYGAAYIQLAQMAAEDNDISSALDLLDRAAPLFPENPFIGLQKAHLLTYSKQPAAAREQIARLPQNWSAIYHQEIPGAITKLQEKLAAADEKKGQSDEKQ